MKILSAYILSLLMLLLFVPSVFAIEDPLAKENNFYGIHILFPSEIAEAKELVNSNGGDWGYVTIPIQITDRDLEKWQAFMDEAARLHIIPILRLATEPYYSDTSVWRKPSDYDVVDLANFLNSLNWPTKNRYIIVFNEMNRFDEWEGVIPNPQEYAQKLALTYTVFKKRSPDFYIIMGGLDNAAPTDGKHMNYSQYLSSMYSYNPDIFNFMDGFASHSYPNPGFSQAPGVGRMSVGTYKHEYDFINARAKTKKPAFITETGWDSQAIGDDKTAEYYKKTFQDIWGADRDKIVAVTPFLLHATGPFDKFSFVRQGKPTKSYQEIVSLQKPKGQPELAIIPPIQNVQGIQTKEKEFEEPEPLYKNSQAATGILKLYTKAVFGML